MKKFVLLLAFVLAALVQVGDVSAQTGQEGAVIAAVEHDGYFRACQSGDLDGCAIFTREVIYRLNPNADPNSWGALSKSGGEEGANSDDGNRYSVDAMVWTANPGNLNNVVDIIGGAGGGNPRAGMGGFVQRRESNRWVAPHALSANEAAHACRGVCANGSGNSGNGGNSGGGNQNPNPQPQPVDLSGVIAKLNELIAHVSELNAHIGVTEQNVAQRLDALDSHLSQVEAQVHRNGAAILEAKNFLENPVPYRGSILGIPVSLNPQAR